MSSTSGSLGRAGTITALVMGVYLATLRTVLGAQGGSPEAVLATIAFAAICLAPAAIGLLGWRRGHGPMLLAAAVLCGLLALISVAALPFLIPAVVLAVASIRMRWSIAGILPATLSAALVIGAGLALLYGPRERCVETATSTTCGHIATDADGLLSLGLLAAGIAIAAIVAAASPRPIIPGDGHPEDTRQP